MKHTTPFDHWVIDDFFHLELARQLEKEFPPFDSQMWLHYDNPLENKKTCNHWDRFPAATYETFTSLLRDGPFVNLPFDVIGDIGLHGGGWHIHGAGGKLNVHQDYSIHPKTGLQRRINLIVYLTEDWKDEWGGGLELWSHDHVNNRPLRLESTIPCRFNRAVIFRTDQQSWHGLPAPLRCPEGHFRKSIAVYYMSNADDNASQRQRALFVPTKEQENLPSIDKLIKLRQQY